MEEHDNWENEGGSVPEEEEELTLSLPRRAMERLFTIARFSHTRLDQMILDAFRRLLANGKHHHG